MPQGIKAELLEGVVHVPSPTRYERLVPNAQDVLHSEVFSGLWLNTVAILRGDIVAVLTTLQYGLARPDHETFVARLHPPNP
jgi:hypothetical protein